MTRLIIALALVLSVAGCDEYFHTKDVNPDQGFMRSDEAKLSKQLTEMETRLNDRIDRSKGVK